MNLYTGKGDDGSTGLYFGGRVRKDDVIMHATGAVDEAQAFMGVARAAGESGSRLDQILIRTERDLWILMAELATAEENKAKLVDGKTRVTAEMLQRLEDEIDALGTEVSMPEEFVVPGQTELAAALDVARTVVRRAERWCVSLDATGSLMVMYLNRLSSLLWCLARWQEDSSLPTRMEDA